MPRKRMMHPEFFTSATLARLEFRTLVTFAGLWVYCDDMGRGEDDAGFITSVVYPRRRDVGPDDVETDLCALADTAGPLVCRYTVGGVGLLHLPSWFEHQKVSHPTPSKLPPCRRCEPSLWTTWWRDTDTATDRFRRAEKAARAAETGLANDSGATREPLRNYSGTTPPSSVQSSSVQWGRRGARPRVIHNPARAAS